MPGHAPTRAAAAAAMLLQFTGASAQGPCQPHWSEDLWASAPPGEGRALTVYDHGAGPVLYIGSAGSDNAVAAWDGTRLKHLGSVTGSMVGSSGTGVYGLAVFDDGSGPALHIGGSFTAVNGVPASGVAKWTGSGWEALGAGMDRGVRALTVYDDGSGPALYASGFFQNAGGLPASSIARWDGQAWSALGIGLKGGAFTPGGAGFPVGHAMAAFDDGSGPALYVGGVFDHAGGSPAMSIARWRQGAWEPVGNGLTWNAVEQGLVLAMGVFDGPGGPSLYVAGRINFGALNPNPLVARWDGTSWHMVGQWIPSIYLTSLGMADFWGTPALHVGAYPWGSVAPVVLRLTEDGWVSIGTSVGPVRALTSVNYGSGNHLYAAGGFTTLENTYVPRVATWDSKHWNRLPAGGAVQPIRRLKTLDLGSGPALYALGSSEIGGQSGSRIMRLDGSIWSPVGAAGPLYLDPLDIEAYDDGTGPALYAGDHGVYRLNAGAWEPVGLSTGGFSVNSVRALQAFHDGSGPRLYAGGSFPGGLRVWDGIAWTAPFGFASISSSYGGQDFEVFDDGDGARLYLAWDSELRKWTGTTWTVVPGSFTSQIKDLVVYDDGDAGPALYAARMAIENPVVRFDGQAWTPVATAATSGGVSVLASFDDGSGPALYAAGSFKSLDRVPADRIARWSAGAWSAAGGLSGPGLTMAVFGTPSPSLWVGGNFAAAGGQSSSNLARLVGCGSSCFADCDASGSLTAADFACFQTRFVAADPYADCNADAALTVADFGCFQTKFVAGCP